MISNEELSYKVGETEQNDEGVRCDVELPQGHLLPPLAGQVDQDGQGEDDGQAAGRPAEPEDSSNVWQEDCEENANGDDGRVQSQNLGETCNIIL